MNYTSTMRVMLPIVVLLASISCSTSAPVTPPPAAREAPKFDLEEATVADLQKRMQSGQDTSRSIVDKYLARIDAIDRNGPALHSVIELNPDAQAIAEQLDAERKAGKVRGPLHGIPVLIKDNIDTADKMTTTAGSLALEGSIAPQDAFIVAAAARGRRGDPRQDQPERVGQLPLQPLDQRLERARRPVKNPYALDRNACGSSSGSGAAGAANLARRRHRHRDRRLDRLPVAASTGSSGSSRRSGWSAAPASFRSRTPRTPSGPMTRTRRRRGHPAGRHRRRRSGGRGHRGQRHQGCARLLDVRSMPNGLKGARIGVVRKGVIGYSPGDRPHLRSRDRRSQAAGRRDRRSGRYPDDQRGRRERAHGAAVRAQGGSQRVPRRPRRESAGPHARGRDRVQQGARRQGDAVLRPGAVRAGAGEGAVDRQGLPRCAGEQTRGCRARKASTR